MVVLSQLATDQLNAFVCKKDFNLIESFCKSHAISNVVQFDSQSPLFLAYCSHDESMFMYLIKCGVRIDSIDSAGNDIASFAALSSDYHWLMLCFKLNANFNSAIEVALIRDDLELFNFIVELFGMSSVLNSKICYPIGGTLLKCAELHGAKKIIMKLSLEL